MIGPLVARLAALLIVGWFAIGFAQSWRGTLPVEFTLRALAPQNGGWVGDPLRVASGRTVRLHLHGVEGAHSLHIAHTDVASDVIAPGDEQTLTFVAPAPGRYVLYCTTWCGLDHWRMRTVLEVIDPNEPDTPVGYVQDAPRFDLPLATMDIDAPHPAVNWPAGSYDAADGALLWQQLAPETPLAQVLADLGWPLASPDDVYTALRSNPVTAAADPTDPELAGLVAFLWQTNSSPTVLARGTQIYSQNCASCHGEDGSGNGFAAAGSPETEPDLRDPRTAAGASPALYYAKTARGGMGTGMPNWGTILSEDDLWAVAAYLYTFLFAGDGSPQGVFSGAEAAPVQSMSTDPPRDLHAE